MIKLVVKKPSGQIFISINISYIIKPNTKKLKILKMKITTIKYRSISAIYKK